jgi:hypothetical protein
MRQLTTIIEEGKHTEQSPPRHQVQRLHEVLPANRWVGGTLPILRKKLTTHQNTKALSGDTQVSDSTDIHPCGGKNPRYTRQRN